MNATHSPRPPFGRAGTSHEVTAAPPIESQFQLMLLSSFWTRTRLWIMEFVCMLGVCFSRRYIVWTPFFVTGAYSLHPCLRVHTDSIRYENEKYIFNTSIYIRLDIYHYKLKYECSGLRDLVCNANFAWSLCTVDTVESPSLILKVRYRSMAPWCKCHLDAHLCGAYTACRTTIDIFSYPHKYCHSIRQCAFIISSLAQHFFNKQK